MHLPIEHPSIHSHLLNQLAVNYIFCRGVAVTLTGEQAPDQESIQRLLNIAFMHLCLDANVQSSSNLRNASKVATLFAELVGRVSNLRSVDILLENSKLLI